MHRPMGIKPRPGRPALSRWQGAAGLVRAVLQTLLDEPDGPPAIDVAAITYFEEPPGQVALRAGFSVASLEQPWLALEDLPEDEEDGGVARPKLGIEPEGVEGGVEAAFWMAHQLALSWLNDHPGALPPLVVHVTEGKETATERIVRSLRVLAGAGGCVGLLNCVLTGKPVQVELPAHSVGLRKASWRRLCHQSSPVKANAGNQPAERARLFCINQVPRRQIVQFLLAPRGSTDSRTGSDLLAGLPEPAALEYRLLQLSKGTNSEEQCEDAFDVNAGRGMAAVSDGAGSGIFSREWAEILTGTLVREGPVPNDPAVFGDWLNRCRQLWFQDLSFDSLTPDQQAKVQRVGTGATLLALRVHPPRRGKTAFPWTAWCVGDSCLFWIRNNRLRATFPALGSEEFGITSALLATHGQAPPRPPLRAEGVGKPGDLFMLATDAIAQMLLQRCETAREPDWSRYLRLDPAEWLKDILDLRRRNLIVDDDCTLLALRVGEAKAASRAP